LFEPFASKGNRTVATFQVMRCLFCDLVAGRQPAHWVWDSSETVAFLDTHPVFKGHVLVIPRTHVDTLLDLPVNLMVPLMATVQRVAAALTIAVGAEGTFVAVNNVVSQSVPHLHVHVVPRRRKDGLRGFFWPRTRYDNEVEAAAVARRIQRVLGADHRLA